MSNRFTFEDELNKAVGEVEVPTLGELAGLQPATDYMPSDEEPPALTRARRAYEVAVGAHDRARAKERRFGWPVPNAITEALWDTYEVYEKESVKFSWSQVKPGDGGPIQHSRTNRFSKGFRRHP